MTRALLAGLLAGVALSGCLLPVFCEPFLAYVWWDQREVFAAMRGPLEAPVEVQEAPAGLPFSHPAFPQRWPEARLRHVQWEEGERWGTLTGPNEFIDSTGVAYGDPIGDPAGLDAFLAQVLDASEAERDAVRRALLDDRARRDAEGDPYPGSLANVSVPTRLDALYGRLLREEGPATGTVHDGVFLDWGWDAWRFHFHVPYRGLRLPLGEPTVWVEARADGTVVLGKGHIHDGETDYREPLGMTGDEARAWAREQFALAGLPEPSFEGFTKIPMSTCSEAYYPHPMGVPVDGDQPEVSGEPSNVSSFWFPSRSVVGSFRPTLSAR